MPQLVNWVSMPLHGFLYVSVAKGLKSEIYNSPQDSRRPDYITRTSTNLLKICVVQYNKGGKDTYHKCEL